MGYEVLSHPRQRLPLTIGLVSDHNSVHVRRWSQALLDRGHTVVPVDLSGRRRSPPERVVAYARLRLTMRRVAANERGVLASHFVPRGVLASGFRGIHPIVLSAWGHDVTAESRGLWGRMGDWQQRELFRAADGVTATSAYLANVVRRRFGVESNVIPFGIDVDCFRPRREARRPGPIRIGFVKVGLEEKYGPDILVEALGLLSQAAPFEVTIAGEGAMADGLRNRVQALGLAERVRFIGRRPHEEIAALLADLDIMVMPSRREEWGVAAAEASASGLPVVATNVGGIPEIVVDGQTGILVPSDDPDQLAAALSTLITDPALRERLGSEGRRRMESLFRWERCVDMMENLYYDVVSARGARRSA